MTKKQIRCECGRRFTVRCECDRLATNDLFFHKLLCRECIAGRTVFSQQRANPQADEVFEGGAWFDP